MRRLVFLCAALAVVATGATGCPAREVAEIQPTQQKQVRRDIPVGVKRDIDILFVIDDSASMNEEQQSLATNFYRFVEVLESIEGGLPNVHIGVVSSNTGIGGYTIAGCSGDGDGGRLQNSAGIPGCTPPQGYFIINKAAASGEGRETNYTGTLADTFSCIATLGTSGCGFEQHLQSMKLALDPVNMPSTNAGFIRPDAYLAVILIADEDDCSASNPALFDTSQQDMSDPVGPLTSFRCTEFGVQCDGGNLVRGAATYGTCEPNDNEQYLHHPRYYVDFLRNLKSDPNAVIVAGIFGNDQPFSVGTDVDGYPELMPSCHTTMGDAAPGVRLKWFVDQFPTRGTFTSICDTNLEDALVVIANLLKRVMGNPCLEGNIYAEDRDGDGIAGVPVQEYDIMEDVPGIQIDCQVSDVRYLDTDRETQTPIRRCAMTDDFTLDPNTEKPCWWAYPNPEKCNGETMPTTLILSVERTVEPPPETWVIANCLTH